MPATVEFADIGGAATGGAQALVDVAAYKNADALVHVVRAFRDDSVPHPSASVDPARDAQAMEDELILADLGVAERRLERLEKDLKKSRIGRARARARRHGALQGRRSKTAQPLRALDLTGDDLKRLRGFQFLSAKPLLIVINLDERRRHECGERRGACGRNHRADGVPVARRDTAPCRSAPRSSSKSRSSSRPTPRRSSRDLGLQESGLDRVIRATYDLLGYMSFFTVGEDECRAWSIPRGTIAQLAAGEIHSDIARGFIRAEVVAYDPLSRADRWPPAAITARCGSRARNTSSPTATSSTSGSPPSGLAGRVAACGTQRRPGAPCNRLV